MHECVAEHLYLIFGIGLHILAIIISLKWLVATKALAAIVILSFVNIQFCYTEELSQNAELAVLIDILIFGFVSAIFLNVYWLLTSTASLVNTISAAYFIIITQGNQNFQIIYPLALGWFLQIYIIY